MPWTMNDYPDSLKNLNEVTRKKAIDIANAMVDEGYEEGRAIPIATAQAEKWYDSASQKEREEYKKSGKPTQRSEEGKKYDSNPELLDEAEEVVSHEKGWAVQAHGAKRPSETFEKKSDAVNRAKEIAENKGTEAVIYKKDGTIQNRHSYSNDN